MGSPIHYAWRVSVTIGRDTYYANRSNLPTPHVAWRTMKEEYPDHYDWSTARSIQDKYSDQRPVLEKVALQMEDA